MNKLYLSVLLLFPLYALAQTEGTDSLPTLRLSGYADVYFAHFTNETAPNELQPYTTAANRNNRFSLNVAQIGAHYRSEKVRGNIIIHYGDIMEATWSTTFRAVQEANIGVNLGDDWWVDAGFFATHIGTESFLPKNNLLASTAVATFNEPFYQSGVKLSYGGFSELDFEFWVSSGYNGFLDNNDAKSVGILLSYHLNEHTRLTYTNIFGRESADDADLEQFRTYHNLYLNARPAEFLEIIAGGDFGTQSNSDINNPNQTAIIFNALATVRYYFRDDFSATFRGEIFQDPEGFISGTFFGNNGLRQGLQLGGFTLGAEYPPIPNAYARLETRYLVLDDNLDIFTSNEQPASTRLEILATLGFTFDKLFTLD